MDWWEQLKDWWEWDSTFREQIILAALVGAIGLAFVILECKAKQRWAPSNGS